jgi:hypothetical protein
MSFFINCKKHFDTAANMKQIPSIDKYYKTLNLTYSYSSNFRILATAAH